MKQLKLICQILFLLVSANLLFAQEKKAELFDFREPVGNWVQANNVEMDSGKPEILIYEPGGDCLINGESGHAKYLVSKKEYQDMELHLEFIIPKGSNSGIYFQCRYEIQLFDSWGATNLTFYDCGGIQQRWDERRPEAERGFDGFAPVMNACKEPGVWQSLEIIFRAPKFDLKGAKVKNASFEKVILNGILVHENAELTGPTRGALSEEEVATAPFRLQGGHGPIAFRNIRVCDLTHAVKSNQ